MAASSQDVKSPPNAPNASLGRFRISTSGLPSFTLKLDGGGLPESVRALLDAAKRTKPAPAQKKELAKLFADSGDAELKLAEAALAEAKKTRDKVNNEIPSAMVMKELPKPRDQPYTPEGVWHETSRYGELRNYKSESGDGLYRRTMCTIWKRSAGPPTLQLVDAAMRDVGTIKRSCINTPLQALALLNEVTFVEAVLVLAQRRLTEGWAPPEAPSANPAAC